MKILRHLILSLALVISQYCSAQETDMQGLQVTSSRLSDNLNRQLHRLDECHATIPHQISRLTELMAHVNGIIAADQGKLTGKLEVNRSTGDEEDMEVYLLESAVFTDLQSLDLLFVMYQSMGGTEKISTKVQYMPSPCASIEAEVKSIAQTQKSIQSKNKATFKKAIIDFSKCTPPDYPRISLVNEEQGTIRLMFLIEANGAVAATLLDISSGSPLLDTAAAEALKLCKFSPATLDGVTQQSWTLVDYVFKLPD
jgi:TonB family protein